MDSTNLTSITLVDRLDRVHTLRVPSGVTLSSALKKLYIPYDTVIAKVNGIQIDEDQYIISTEDKIMLNMVRAYQLPEYCRMLRLWEDNTNQIAAKDNPQIYSKKTLWFNENGISDLKFTSFTKDDFVPWLEENFVQGIIDKNLISEGDNLCLAVSGGRDSLALLYLLQRNKHRLPNFNLFAVTVADSAASLKDIQVAQEAAKNLGVSNYTILDSDYVNSTMNYTHGFSEAIEAALQNQGRGRSIAIWHCVMRANVERFAREQGITKICFGYHFEDLMASVFRSYTLGVLYGESVQRKTWGQFELISPLWTITKKELTTYLELVAPAHHSKQGSPTDYDRGDHNRDINYFMTDLLSSVYPGLGYSLFESLENMVKSYQIKKPNFHECKNCGIIYHDGFMQGTLIDENYCDHCLYLEGLGHASKVRLVK